MTQYIEKQGAGSYHGSEAEERREGEREENSNRKEEKRDETSVREQSNEEEAENTATAPILAYGVKGVTWS